METRRVTGFARLWTWGSNLAVFILLGAVGAWGHATHWTLPKFSDLFATAVAHESDPAASSTQPAADTKPFPDHLPAVEFRSPDAARNCGIETRSAEQRSMNDIVIANGAVAYDETRIAQLAVRVPGIVWRVEKRIGDPVKRGDTLVIVDSAEVGQAKADLLEASVVYKLKTENVKRMGAIPGLVPERTLREAEAAQEVASVQRLNAVQKLVNLGFPILLSDSTKLTRDELAERLHLLGMPTSLAVETQSGNLIPLSAPFEGIITKCAVVQGEIVEPSQPQYVVADISRMWINLDVRQEDAVKLSLGATVTFHSEAGVRPVSGILTWIGTEVDPTTRMVQARAEADNPFLDESHPDHRSRRLLQANSFGSAHIVVKNNPTAVVVRNEALHWQWELGREVVFVSSADSRRFEPRIVRKGLVNADYVQILDGLDAGERVVTAGSRILASELSERLQPHLGENADSVRIFDDAQAPTSSQN